MSSFKSVNIIEDVANITTILVASLQKLNDKFVWCMCNAVEESKLKEEEFVSLNIGYGTLMISVVNNQIQYKFVPSNYFEKNLVSTIVNGKNPLINALESNLVNKIVEAYKDLF